MWAKIPEGLDLLVTHTPPYQVGNLDVSEVSRGLLRKDGPVSIGDPLLLRRLQEMPLGRRPKAHVFGREHDPGGRVHWDPGLHMWFATCAAPARGSGRSTSYSLRPDFSPVVLDFDLEDGGVSLSPGGGAAAPPPPEELLPRKVYPPPSVEEGDALALRRCLATGTEAAQFVFAENSAVNSTAVQHVKRQRRFAATPPTESSAREELLKPSDT